MTSFIAVMHFDDKEETLSDVNVDCRVNTKKNTHTHTLTHTHTHTQTYKQTHTYDYSSKNLNPLTIF